VDGARGEKKGHQVDVASCEAIGWNICSQLIDDGTYRMSVHCVLRVILSLGHVTSLRQS
jgi:hypothetical protein